MCGLVCLCCGFEGSCVVCVAFVSSLDSWVCGFVGLCVCCVSVSVCVLCAAWFCVVVILCDCLFVELRVRV